LTFGGSPIGPDRPGHPDRAGPTARGGRVPECLGSRRALGPGRRWARAAGADALRPDPRPGPTTIGVREAESPIDDLIPCDHN
jgi:hypothetical protein